VHSFLVSQHDAVSALVEQENKPIDSKINKFFIFIFILYKVYAII